MCIYWQSVNNRARFFFFAVLRPLASCHSFNLNVPFNLNLVPAVRLDVSANHWQLIAAKTIPPPRFVLEDNVQHQATPQARSLSLSLYCSSVLLSLRQYCK